MPLIGLTVCYSNLLYPLCDLILNILRCTALLQKLKENVWQIVSQHVFFTKHNLLAQCSYSISMLFWCFFGVLSSKKCGSLVALVFLYYLLIDVNAIIGTKAVLVRPLERVSAIPQF